MKRHLSRITLVCAFAVLVTSASSFAVSTITVGSVNTVAGTQDVVIPVFLKNEVEIRSLTIPLLIRQIGPAYVDRIQLSVGDRMIGALDDIVFFNHYDDGTTDTAQCKTFQGVGPKAPGGFLGLPFVNSTDQQTVTGVPYGIMFVRSRLFSPNLPAGWDKTGSLLISADINSHEGCFEVDSACVEPFNHVQFANAVSVSEPITFRGGVIHVGVCTGVVLGAPSPTSLSPVGWTSGPQEVTLMWEAVPYAGGYEVQVDNVDETFNNLIAQVTVQGTEYDLSIAEGESIYWRVRAVPSDCSFCFGEWVTTGDEPVAAAVAIDIKPQSCPNPLNIKAHGNSKGVLPVAILGDADFDVEDIDPSSILLEGVAPVRWSMDDVSRPVAGDSPSECECTTNGPDGYMDLTLKFPKREIIDALGSVDNGDAIELVLTGNLLNEDAFTGSDCVVIRGHRASNGQTDIELTAGQGGIALSNYPNPFNARTTISFALDDAKSVQLSVYNILGQIVVTLIDGPQEAGQHFISWDGRTSSGDVVPSGMYFYRLTAGDVTESRKMILLK